MLRTCMCENLPSTPALVWVGNNIPSKAEGPQDSVSTTGMKWSEPSLNSAVDQGSQMASPGGAGQGGQTSSGEDR